ncbi:hypothetical protein BC826DRAFT_722093 [Russula brevipes]|nr:hypothetical protein BC826DRAFT_722093 [Russula brevipes]
MTRGALWGMLVLLLCCITTPVLAVHGTRTFNKYTHATRAMPARQQDVSFFFSNYARRGVMVAVMIDSGNNYWYWCNATSPTVRVARNCFCPDPITLD